MYACALCVHVQDGVTPLFAAVLNGHVEAVRALVELGASVNQAKVRASFGVVGVEGHKRGTRGEVVEVAGPLVPSGRTVW